MVKIRSNLLKLNQEQNNIQANDLSKDIKKDLACDSTQIDIKSLYIHNYSNNLATIINTRNLDLENTIFTGPVNSNPKKNRLILDEEHMKTLIRNLSQVNKNSHTLNYYFTNEEYCCQSGQVENLKSNNEDEHYNF